MRNGEPLESLARHEREWLVKAAVDLLQHGITDKQDSGVFYRICKRRDKVIPTGGSYSASY